MRALSGTPLDMQKNAKSLIEAVHSSGFEGAVLKHDGPVLVDFSTTWCGPCRALTPILEQLAAEKQATVKVVAVDGDEAAEITARYGVRGFPTVILFQNGVEKSRRLGLTTKKKLEEMLAEATASANGRPAAEDQAHCGAPVGADRTARHWA